MVDNAICRQMQADCTLEAFYALMEVSVHTALSSRRWSFLIGHTDWMKVSLSWLKLGGADNNQFNKKIYNKVPKTIMQRSTGEKLRQQLHWAFFVILTLVSLH